MGDRDDTQMLGKIPLSIKNSFRIRLVKSTRASIGVGIVDAKHKSMRDVNLTVKNGFIFNGTDGIGIILGRTLAMKPKRIKRGDFIEVTVCVERGSICWKRNG